MDGTGTGGQQGWWRRLTDGLRLRGLRSRPRRLRLCEMLPLGERRFVAVIECDQQQFLIGGSATQVQLLANLDPASGPSPSSLKDSLPARADAPSLTVK